MQKNIVTGVFVLMFFVLVWYVWKTTKKPETTTTTTVAPTTTPPPQGTGAAGSSNWGPGGAPTPKPKPVSTELDYSKQLNLGSTGPEVKKLQNAANAAGVKDQYGKKLVEDGSYGQKTKYVHELIMAALGTSDRSLNAIKMGPSGATEAQTATNGWAYGGDIPSAIVTGAASSAWDYINFWGQNMNLW